jgi:hypothetical protein
MDENVKYRELLYLSTAVGLLTSESKNSLVANRLADSFQNQIYIAKFRPNPTAWSPPRLRLRHTVLER